MCSINLWNVIVLHFITVYETNTLASKVVEYLNKYKLQVTDCPILNKGLRKYHKQIVPFSAGACPQL